MSDLKSFLRTTKSKSRPKPTQQTMLKSPSLRTDAQGCRTGFQRAQSKLDAALASQKGQELSIKGELGRFQAASNTLKQHVEQHNKLHMQLQESFKKGEAQAAIVDELQAQYKKLLKQDGVVQSPDAPIASAPIKMPKDCNGEQKK